MRARRFYASVFLFPAKMNQKLEVKMTLNNDKGHKIPFTQSDVKLM